MFCPLWLKLQFSSWDKQESLLFFLQEHIKGSFWPQSGCLSIKEEGPWVTRDPFEGVVLAARRSGRNRVCGKREEGRRRKGSCFCPGLMADGFPCLGLTNKPLGLIYQPFREVGWKFFFWARLNRVQTYLLFHFEREEKKKAKQTQVEHPSQGEWHFTKV